LTDSVHRELSQWPLLEISAETTIKLSASVWRITAANPGLMTGPGTNSYLLIGENCCAIVDPGPDDTVHREALLAAVAASGKPLHYILLTHTHRDHSPGSSALVARTGAKILGCPPLANDPSQDRDTVIDEVLVDQQEWLALGWPLKVVATPGHVENHLCFFCPHEGWLITGDHLIQGSTVVIIPPHGRLADYIASLEKLLDFAIDAILPGHGKAMLAAHDVIRGTIAHRLQREHKVLERFVIGSQHTLMELVESVYDDVQPWLHPVARFSLLAHLIKLAEEGRVSQVDDNWQRLH
jgi:hydroxyacylglutathione hydrolase